MGWGSGRRRGLRVWVLQLLEQRPMNGAELMDQMDRMTMGWWRPSPGSIYPLLEELEKDGLAKKQADGRYQLTEKAEAGPSWMGPGGMFGHSPRDAEETVTALEGYAQFLEDLANAPRSRLPQYKERLVAVAARLQRIAAQPPRPDA